MKVTATLQVSGFGVISESDKKELRADIEALWYTVTKEKAERKMGFPGRE